jgi:hypothetical protein
VFENNNPDEIILTRRFMVVDSKVTISSEVHRSAEVSTMQSHQEIDFSINTVGMQVMNARSEVKTVLMQNFRWDNAITDLQPLFIRNEILDYHYNTANSFAALKEFRRFDTRSIRYRTERIVDIVNKGQVTEATVQPEEPRAGLPYFFEKDANGKFVTGIYEGSEPQIEADYVLVHFFLISNYPGEEPVYLFGKLTDWQCLPAFRMHYNAAYRAYELSVLLKQGYHEYVYASPLKNGEINAELWEGNSHETENAYQILVYYRPFGERYDQLIGYKATDTFNR